MNTCMHANIHSEKIKSHILNDTSVQRDLIFKILKKNSFANIRMCNTMVDIIICTSFMVFTPR